ncbi:MULTISPECIES: ABC transporter ATP-binding protein [unclassified Modestobacter]
MTSSTGLAPSTGPAPEVGQVLLDVEALRVEFARDGVVTPVLHGISYRVDAGEFVGIIGETGSGKSVSLRGALEMLPRNGRVTGGRSTFLGRDLQALRGRELRAVKGEQIGFVPQQPWSALNPIMTIEKQFLAVGRSHGRSSAWTKDAARQMLRRVEITDTERVLRGYVGELSGGMAQRVLIAMSLVLSPVLLVADEPTTALDLTVQRDVLDVITGICREDGTGVLLVTHDLGVVSNYCDTVYVMNAGRVLESGPVDRVFSAPTDPYTRGLVVASSRHVREDDYAAAQAAGSARIATSTAVPGGIHR